MKITGTGNCRSILEKEPEKQLLLLREAAGAKITQWRLAEVVKTCNNVILIENCDWNELRPNHAARIKWRKSLVPAPAVIPAPRVYINAVAVKTFVV